MRSKKNTKNRKDNKLFTISQILKLKNELNNVSELKDVRINIGLEKSKIISIVIDTEVSHTILIAIARTIIRFEDLNKVIVDYIVVTNEEIKTHDIKFKYFV